MQALIHIAGYLFVPLTKLEAWQSQCKDFCKVHTLKGTVVFSPEGVNIMLAGEEAHIDAFINWLNNFPEFANIKFKHTATSFMPFRRMYVKIKPVLVPGKINPLQESAPQLAPEELKRWYEQGKDFIIIDTRNDYELAIGKFAHALDIHLKEFKDFETALAQLDPALKEKPAVFYCTGGIRCEKAAPLAKRAGFKEVYQLAGGILNYFKECGAAHYQGDCYVFDERVALTPELKIAK
jgi:predicted sulfurtransferase